MFLAMSRAERSAYSEFVPPSLTPGWK